MSIAITPSLRAEIEYPDSDGQPMSDNTLQFQWIVTIKEGLEALYRNDGWGSSLNEHRDYAIVPTRD